MSETKIPSFEEIQKEMQDSTIEDLTLKLTSAINDKEFLKRTNEQQLACIGDLNMEIRELRKDKKILQYAIEIIREGK